MSDLAKLQRELALPFRDPALCEEALTHKSFAAEHRLKYDNQRLELLGDAVVQIVLTRYLYDRYPALQEGDLTKIRSALANQDSLAALARKISLGSYLLLGHGESELNGQDRDSTLCDAFEAFLGAVYLDSGLDKATEFFLKILLEVYPDPSVLLRDLNPKGALQEYTQQLGAGIPQYRVIAVAGPDHDPVYTVELSVKGRVISVAAASSRKLAEREAARAALETLHHEENKKNGNDNARHV